MVRVDVRARHDALDLSHPGRRPVRRRQQRRLHLRDQLPCSQPRYLAASAIAGNSVVCSLLGATLQLAGPAMYARLGPHWAGPLLGHVQVAIFPIAVIFYKYGARIRERSALISSIQVDKARLEGNRAKVAGGKDETLEA